MRSHTINVRPALADRLLVVDWDESTGLFDRDTGELLATAYDHPNVYAEGVEHLELSDLDVDDADDLDWDAVEAAVRRRQTSRP